MIVILLLILVVVVIIILLVTVFVVFVVVVVVFIIIIIIIVAVITIIVIVTFITSRPSRLTFKDGQYIIRPVKIVCRRHPCSYCSAGGSHGSWCSLSATARRSPMAAHLHNAYRRVITSHRELNVARL